MELLLLFPELQSKNFFYKMCLTLTNESKTGFLTSTSRLHLKFIYTSTRLQLLAKPELGTTPAPACYLDSPPKSSFTLQLDFNSYPNLSLAQLQPSLFVANITSKDFC